MRSMWTTCVQLVEKAWDACGQSVAVVRSQFSFHINHWITGRLFRVLCTFCIQQYTGTVGKFTSVIGRLYTQYTGLTKTTTN